MRWLEVGGETILHATGKRAAAEALVECASVSLVILNVAAEAPEGCRVYDLKRLDDTGALSIRAVEDGIEVRTVREATGSRLWSP